MIAEKTPEEQEAVSSNNPWTNLSTHLSTDIKKKTREVFTVPPETHWDLHKHVEVSGAWRRNSTQLANVSGVGFTCVLLIFDAMLMRLTCLVACGLMGF